MPRSRAKKPGCFSTLKPSLLFTESPPDKLPRRLCSPQALVDNPVTARVCNLNDGLEVTWVSPQFHPGMLEAEEPRRRRKRKQEGKSAMSSQKTATQRLQPVLRSSLATPTTKERRRPFKPLQFVADRPPSRRSHIKRDASIGGARKDGDADDVSFDEDDLSENRSYIGFKVPKTKKTSRLEVSRGQEKQKTASPTDLHGFGCHGNDSMDDKTEKTASDQRLLSTGRRVTRLRTSFASKHPDRADSRPHDSGHHGDSNDEDDDGDDVNDVQDENDATDCGVDIHQRDPGDDFCLPESPKFARGDKTTRAKIRRKSAQDSLAVTQCSPRFLSELNRTGISEEQTAKVLVADTPINDYGLRVSVRRRRDLLPRAVCERLLLDT
ncbi:uncharacterized protein [Diadema antillarum]|uniref:uncharacterized protein n=1 Tax=Diadema antillarum TaxID=105358 RepID=UPI003A8B5A85